MNSLFDFSFLLAAQPSGDGGGTSLLPTLLTFGLIFVVFYFLIMRPQRKREKEMRLMRESVQKGDKIITAGGIHGTVDAVREKTVIIKVSETKRR